MSEESDPKPFRLKPRVRPDEAAAAGETPSVSPDPAPVELTPNEETAAPKLRLKPRLTPDAPAQSAAPGEETPPDSAPLVTPPPAPPVPEEAPVESASSAERFRLKPRLAPEPPAEASAESSGESAAAVTEPAASPPPPIPPRIPPPIHLKAPKKDEEEIAAQAAPPPKRRKPRRKFLSVVLTLIVVGAAGYLGWTHFMAPAPGPSPVAVTPPLTPSATLNKIAAAPADLIAKAQAAINDRRDSEQGRVDAAEAGRALPEERAIPTPPPGDLAAAPSTPTPDEFFVSKIDREEKQSVIAPGITATTTTVVSSIKASAEFRSFVAAMRINGVFQGSPARALINGRTYREGDLVNPTLGIVFERVIADDKLIIFRDRSDATVERSY